MMIYTSIWLLIPAAMMIFGFGLFLGRISK